MKQIRCDLCGYEFDARAGAERCTPACPLKSACHFICCPRCGYQIVDGSRMSSVKFVEWLRQQYVERKKKETT